MRWFLSIAVAMTCAGCAQRAVGQSSDQAPVLPPPGSGVPTLLPVEKDVLLPIDATEDIDTLLTFSSSAASDTATGAVVPVSLIEPAAPQPVLAWYEPAYWFGPDPWDIGFELGLNGNEGINEAFSLRSGAHVKRKTEFWKFDTSLVYNKNTANNVETQNNALVDVRVDRLLGESPWSIYLLNQELYDEFQAFDLRVALNSGVGYQLIDTEIVDLLGRFGAGASREFGGPDDRWAYEALFGLEYEQQLSATQRLAAKVDYFPEWENFGFYRVVTDVGWEIDLDRPQSVSLKFSVIDRYDSTPNGVDPNEVNYAALLIWGL